MVNSSSKRPERARWIRSLGMMGVLGVLAASQGCVCRDNLSLFIDGVVPITNAPECTVDEDPSFFLAGGIWDVAVSNIYTLNVHVVSGLVATGNPGGLAAEPNYINMEGFNIAVTAPTGVGGFGQVAMFVNVAGVIPPGGALNIAGLPLLGPDVAEDVRTDLSAGGSYQVIVTLSPTGETLGGTAILGAEFSFPVLVCYGCLVYGCDASGACGTPPSDLEPPCNPGQDDTVHCASVGLSNCP